MISLLVVKAVYFISLQKERCCFHKKPQSGPYVVSFIQKCCEHQQQTQSNVTYNTLFPSDGPISHEIFFPWIGRLLKTFWDQRFEESEHSVEDEVHQHPIQSYHGNLLAKSFSKIKRDREFHHFQGPNPIIVVNPHYLIQFNFFH